MGRLRETNLSQFLVSWTWAWSFGDHFNVTFQPLPTPGASQPACIPYLLFNFFWLFLWGRFLGFFSLLILFIFLCLCQCLCLFGSQLLNDLKEELDWENTISNRLHSLNPRPSQRSLFVLTSSSTGAEYPNLSLGKGWFLCPKSWGLLWTKTSSWSCPEQNILMTHNSKFPLDSDPDDEFIMNFLRPRWWICPGVCKADWFLQGWILRGCPEVCPISIYG